MLQKKKSTKGKIGFTTTLRILFVATLLLQNPLIDFFLKRFGKTTQAVLIREEVKETRLGASTLMYEFFIGGCYYKGVSGIVDPYYKRVGEGIAVRYLVGWPSINRVE